MEDDKNKQKPEPKEEQEVVLPRCPHCGAVPIACKRPGNCKYEDLRK